MTADMMDEEMRTHAIAEWADKLLPPSGRDIPECVVVSHRGSTSDKRGQRQEMTLDGPTQFYSRFQSAGLVPLCCVGRHITRRALAPRSPCIPEVVNPRAVTNYPAT